MADQTKEQTVTLQELMVSTLAMAVLELAIFHRLIPLTDALSVSNFPTERSKDGQFTDRTRRMQPHNPHRPA
jgi:hypothetical protein